MLRGAIWAKLALPTETLCDDCLFQRARERQVTLTFDDLQPGCLFNLLGPPSWFDRLGGVGGRENLGGPGVIWQKKERS
jgi:hypothetical protein